MIGQFTNKYAKLLAPTYILRERSPLPNPLDTANCQTVHPNLGFACVPWIKLVLNVTVVIHTAIMLSNILFAVII